MKEITVKTFRNLVHRDPAWASKLTEPVEISGKCQFIFSKIRNLSPLLHFTYRDTYGYCASFKQCPSLKVAQGHFAGAVNFSGSGITEIGNLVIEKPHNSGMAALFNGCKLLKIARGTFPGYVGFRFSGIEEIRELIVTGGYDGKKIAIECCGELKAIPKNFKASEIEWGEHTGAIQGSEAHKNIERLMKEFIRRGSAKSLQIKADMEI